MFDRLIRGESRRIGGNLEQNTARLAKINRVEILTIQNRRHIVMLARELGLPLPLYRVRLGSKGHVVHCAHTHRAASGIGLAQDMLGHNPIGIYGIAKTVVGYGASSLGVKLDVENAGARLLVTLGFYFLHAAVYFTVAHGLVNMTQTWSWPHGLLAGLANAFLGVILYFLLDKFKQRT